MQNRKMAFFEIASCQLGEDVQREFERAHKISKEREVPIVVTLKMKVLPPDDTAMYGSVQYAVDLKEPPKISAKHTTVINNLGLPVRDSMEPVNQINLIDEAEENTVTFKQINEGVQ